MADNGCIINIGSTVTQSFFGWEKPMNRYASLLV